MISRLWNRVFRFLFKHIILVLTLLFCASAGIAISNMSRLSSSLIVSQAIQNAASYADSVNQAITLYSDAAVQRADPIPGIEVTHAYLIERGGIPLPSTFAIELGDRISANTEMSVRLYSDYPFPWRKEKGGPKDKFERDALQALRENPKTKFTRRETQGGHSMLRYGEASIMQHTCVACHNTHLDSPKKDWEVGDVAGVLEISQPLDRWENQVSSHLRETSMVLGGISFVGLSGISLVVGRLRQTARELEGRVHERTADLAQVNTDLEKRNQLIRRVFGRYLSDEVVVTLLEHPEGLQLGGERRKITILTSDLRGFTALSEQLTPEEVITVLNLYLEYMADVINKYQGTIDEFLGDGILVLFGAPTLRADDATRAVACACAMQLAMGAVNERMKSLSLPSLAMGIGIHTGEVVVGNIGSEKRSKYGIVGSPVNLTYRIESYTRGGEVLISEETLAEAGSAIKINGKKQVQPKGMKQPIFIYDVYGVSGFYNLYLPQEKEEFYPVPNEIPLQYTILEGKHIGDIRFQGRLVRLSAKGAEVRLDAPDGDGSEAMPSRLTNLKLNFLNPNDVTRMSDDFYAKVSEHLPTQNGFVMHFTAVPPGLQSKLDGLYESIALPFSG